MPPGDAGCGPGRLAAWCLLTGGIALGSWWAYYELGWGGYWFWDPVENASLLPWLSGTALLHSAIVVEKREALKIWTILLAIGTFSLSLCGTFLVRSGILNSVHSFANDPTRGVFILALLAIVIGGSLLLFALRAPVMAPTGIFAPISREGALVLNNILLCSICAVVLTGTTYPLFAELLFGAKLSVGPPYFQSDGVSAGDPVVPRDVARPGAAVEARRTLAGAAQTVVGGADRRASSALRPALGLRAGLAALGFAASAWLIFGALAELVERTRLFRAPFATVRARLAAQPLSVWGSAVAHAGMGVTVAGIAGMSLAASTIVAVHPGQSVQLGGYDWTLLALRDEPGPNYTARVADIRVSRGGDEVAMFHPSRRLFTVQKTTVTDTAIADQRVARSLCGARRGARWRGGAAAACQSAGTVDLVRRAGDGGRRCVVAGRSAAARRRAGAAARGTGGSGAVTRGHLAPHPPRKGRGRRHCCNAPLPCGRGLGGGCA